ncbi:MAG TPA: hypothetical protein VN213_10635, partial [Solirubrobacteraceae bacterium]|nr:hypothetical protein [Solirubrobacteraceae bacterium]
MTHARRVRIKWGNVARVAVAVPAVVLVAAWPRLGGEAPVVPDDRPVPVAAAPAAAGAAPVRSAEPARVPGDAVSRARDAERQPGGPGIQ